MPPGADRTSTSRSEPADHADRRRSTVASVAVGPGLLPHATTASGVTWREATKYLPAAMKRELDKARLGRTAAR